MFIICICNRRTWCRLIFHFHKSFFISQSPVGRYVHRVAIPCLYRNYNINSVFSIHTVLYLHINWFVTTNDIDTVKDNPSKPSSYVTVIREWNETRCSVRFLYYYLRWRLNSFCPMYNIIVVRRLRQEIQSILGNSKTSNLFLPLEVFLITRVYNSKIHKSNLCFIPLEIRVTRLYSWWNQFGNNNWRRPQCTNRQIK